MTNAILIINANVTKPPVSPVGLEYVAESLVEHKVAFQILDLSFETDWQQALARELKHTEPLAVALSVRNTDDSSFVSKKSFLPWITEVVTQVRQLTEAFVILGGVGFSVMPEDVLRLTGADVGIAGDGEVALPALTKCLANSDDISHLPNLVYWYKGNVVSNPRTNNDLRHLPVPRRRIFDNRKYQELGAMVGVETKRGCPEKCSFCADPVAKGSKVRQRPPRVVAEEFLDLVAQGVSWFHLCDSEFNIPIGHAKEICRAMIETGLGDKMRWYCYCSPTPFDRELAVLMMQSGCAGINFGVDSLDDEQLFRLRKVHRLSDIYELVHLLKDVSLNYIFDLLIGAPGETEETVRTTIERVKQLNVPLAGIAAGVRVYPGTLLGRTVYRGSINEGLHPWVLSSPDEPLYYLSPDLGSDASELISQLVAGDTRFLFLSAPADKGSYNYAGDQALSQMIAKGARGAYWDIIRQHRDFLP